ncbi:hypothetical protein DPMN_131842 [Dreissena polymorpha]|uniref:Uncharacterized protein n=1 Tax=Dreissena polymorpha TaxID=45954 RepID=A0A9D4FUR8_DREPO|nr:hypothetical protein DPMN_131842 [Dreissena polymorpha]
MQVHLGPLVHVSTDTTANELHTELGLPNFVETHLWVYDDRNSQLLGLECVFYNRVKK